MPRQALRIAFAVMGTVACTLAPAADLTPDSAYDLVTPAVWSKAAPPAAEQVAAARKVLEAQAAREPKAAKWAYALGRIADYEADRATGDARKDRRKEEVERFERAVELEPGRAEYQYWLGSAAFDHVDDVNMLSQMSLASKGRKALEKAIEIDGAYLPARVGLAEFYLQAPSIAGGSVDKAKEQADTMLRMTDNHGDFQGHMLRARIAAQEKNWAEMSKEYTLAESAKGEGHDALTAMRTNALLLLTRAKDPQTAAPVVERYEKAAPADDVTAWFLDAEVKRQLGHCAEALPRYDQVLAKIPEARGSRWGAAVCHDQLGQKDAARRDYEEFLKRYPDDDRSKEAKTAIKRLSGS